MCLDHLFPTVRKVLLSWLASLSRVKTNRGYSMAAHEAVLWSVSIKAMFNNMSTWIAHCQTNLCSKFALYQSSSLERCDIINHSYC